MKRRLLCLFIVMTLMVSLFGVNLPVAAQVNIYVDATNTGDPAEDGSIAHPFDKIQEGITAATAGDTVVVGPGTYVENLVLPSGIDLFGAGIGQSIVDGAAVDTTIDATGNFAIKGFTITGGSDYGIAYGGSGTSLIEYNEIAGNYAGIYVWGVGATTTIQNNVIHHNSHNGICVYSGSTATIVNNTVDNNDYGIATIDTPAPELHLTNNIVTANGPVGISFQYSSATSTLSNNDVWNHTANYEGVAPGATDISADPLFVNAAAGNYHLTTGSPCIDAGTNTGAPAADFEGDPRPIDGDSDTVATTDIGADEYVPGEPALSFDGLDDYVDCGSNASLDLTEAITIEAWIKTTDNSGYQVIVDKRNGPAEMNYLVRLNNGYLKFTFYNGGYRDLQDDTTKLLNNTFYYLAVTYDRVNIRLYVNGVEVKSVGETDAMIPDTSPLTIGKQAYSNSSHFSGLIDEVRISDIARTPAEITAAWNGGVGQRFVLDDDTTALWHMDEGTGSTISDETAINNGTIYGADWVDGFPFPSEAPPGVISQIAFTNPERTVLVNEAAEMTIETQDGGSSVNVAAATTINLSSTSGTGEFSLSPDPWTPLTSLLMSTGASSATFYYKDSAIGTPTITAYEFPDDGWTDAQQLVTIQGPVQLWREGNLNSTYLAIQEAINAAIDNDTIIVFPGTYYEQIRIGKQITVKSQDGAATTIIDAQFGKDVICDFGGDVKSYPAVWIQRDGVEFGDVDMGFTIMNTPPMVFPEGQEEPSEWGVAILANAPGCTIRGNIIEDSNPLGIWADVEATIISQNTVEASIFGIYGGGGGGSILYNDVDSGYWGILVESGQGNNNVSNNTVSNTWGGAIAVQSGDNHQITNNELYDNQGMAISLQNTSNAEVSGNLITTATTDVAGIYGIDVEGGQNNTISNNTIEYVLIGGISLNNTSENNLYGNEIWDIYGYDLSGVNGGDANWTREESKFDRFSVKLETGEDPSGIARLEIPSIFPFQYAEIGGALYFWAYLKDWTLPTYQLELDNGVILEANTGGEGLGTGEWLKLFAVGGWTHINTATPVSKSLSDWITQYPDAKVVKISVVYTGAADRTMYIDGPKQEGMQSMPMEPPKGIVIGRSDRNSVSDTVIVGSSDVGVLIVESHQNMIGDNNTISNNESGIYIENSNENKVWGSTISDNYRGIRIIHSYSNQIIGNNITGNMGASGVHLDGESEGNEIHANNIVDNTPRDGDGNIIRDGESNITSFGVVKDGDWEGTTGWVNASGNWWGDASGPYHEWRNPGGMGDAVSNEFVHFEPWVYPDALPEFIEPTLVGNLAMPRMTAVLSMFMGDVGPEQTTLVVEAYDDEGGVGIAKVGVNLRELLMQMLPSPIVIDLRTDNPPFNDERVRQAMSMAIDYDTLRSELGGYGNIVLNPGEGLPTEYNPQAAIDLLIAAGYGQGFQTEIYIHPHYGELASMLMDYWAAIGVNCEINVVDMGELTSRIYNREYEQMVCFPYGWGMVTGGNIENWQDWLNELERSHLQHQDHGVYRRDFELQDEFMKWLRWYLDEDDEQRIMDKLTLGDFSIPVTVADWCGNKVSGNIDLTVVDIMQPLQEGWNLISTPVTLEGEYATWENLVALGDGLLFSDAIRYDSALGEWVGVNPTDELKPLEPIYIHTTGNDQIGAIFNRGVTLPPTLDLGGGWNLVGLAIPPTDWDSMPVDEALVTAEDASGYRGYSIVISPDQQVDYKEESRYQDNEGREYGFGGYNWGFEQESWGYTAGSDDIKEMSIGGGYWVFMEAADTLAGFSTTPVTRVFRDEPGHDLDPLVPRYNWERVTRTLCEEYHDGEGYTKVYLTYSGNVSPSRVVEFYQQRMGEYGWELTTWEGSEDSASLDFTKVMGAATFSCQIDVVGGKSIDILFELWEPGVDLPDVLRFDWEPVAMTAYSQTTDSTGTQTNISYVGGLDHEDACKFYSNLEEHLKEKGYEEYNWEKIDDECQQEFAWLMFKRGDEEGRTYICLIWAERGIIEIEHRVFEPSVPEDFVEAVISFWRQEIEMRKWAMW